MAGRVQVPWIAALGGTATTPYGSHIGTLAVGKAADLVLIDWDKLAYPYLDPETPALAAILQRANSGGVDLVVVAGEVVYEGVSRGSTGTRHFANCRSHCSMCSAMTRSSGGPFEGAPAPRPAFL